MKKTVLVSAFLLATSCALAQNYTKGNPNDATNYGYLSDYAPLKDYIDYSRFPNFKLGIGTTVVDYLNDATVKGMTNDNFTETVAGNAMKMSSCVRSDGSMDFNTVKNYVKAATEAGLNIYGHTLAWHSQQAVGWLNSLLRDAVAEPIEKPDTMVYVEVVNKDFRTQQSVGWTSDKAQFGYSIDFSSTDGLHVNNPKQQANFWDLQFQAVTGLTLQQGKTYVATITIKGSGEGTLYTRMGDWNAGVSVNTKFSSEWQDLQLTYENSTGGDFLLLQCGDFVGDVYIRNIKISESIGGLKQPDGSVKLPQSKPLSAEQKRDTLIWAMDSWIKGMMEACDGKVKAWDVVNEAISGGGDDGEGFYTLQHDDGNAANFFWQDHMGDLEYVRNAVRLARKYGPEDIKLFINDYNLESDWDDNKKLKSLIHWIKKWEADGETHIDGIGTQMHISCYTSQATMNSKKKHIENMFRLMAETGKLVRVSEFDMGMVDASNKEVPTTNMTEAMHKQMAEFYEWVVAKYLEIVPPAQQWGICFWCPTDSPANSGWRANMPVGIWTLDHYRKHAYAGIAKGLGGVVYTGIGQIENDYMDAPKGIFTLSGQKLPDGTQLTSLPKGIYVINGKKTIIK